MSNGTNVDLIDKKLKVIFLSRFGFNMERIDKERMDKELLGNEFRFSPRDLLCLHCFVEKEFDIVVPQKAVVEGRFNTYNNILSIIKNETTCTEC